MNKSKFFIVCTFIASCFVSFLTSCNKSRSHTAPAIREKDSVPIMTTYGVNTLISDSGVIKYRIVAEEWEVNEIKKPSRWSFNKGLLLMQFDLKKHVVGYMQCDTAIYFDKIHRWELHGNVRIVTAQKTQFYSNELFWDEQNHEIWSNVYSHLKTPEKELEGNWFKSDEQMTRYEIRQVKGWGIFKEQEFNPNSMQNVPLAPIDTLSKANFKGKIFKR